MNIDPQAATMMLEGMLQPWHEAVADPGKAQEAVLQRLLKDYSQTTYGEEHNAEQIGRAHV